MGAPKKRLGLHGIAFLGPGDVWGVPGRAFLDEGNVLEASKRRLGVSWQSFFGSRKRLGNDMTCIVHFEIVRSPLRD